MMPATVAELAAGKMVKVARLYRFEFRSSTKQFWDGLNWFTTNDGERWQGAGKLISASGLEQSEGMTAAPANFQLSGCTPDLLAAAIDSDTEIKDRPAAVFLQFLSDRYVPLDDPIAIWVGKMGSAIIESDVTGERIGMSAETLWIDRTRAPHGYLTDTDQQARWPGDRGMEFAPLLKNKTVPWLRA